MRLVTFHDKLGRQRIGALVAEGRIADLNAAYKLYVRDKGNDEAEDAVAYARVPTDMRRLFEGGDRSLDAARMALDYLISQILNTLS